jgi:AcrR family transcriptional regulator
MRILNQLRFKDQTFRLREQAVLTATKKLLARKGFDLMTMDDVAAEAGISKPSLYKHFKSKDQLATEVMIRLLDSARDYLDQLDTELSPIQKLAQLLEWALRTRLDDGLPFLPSNSPHVKALLRTNIRYLCSASKLHNALQGIVEKAKLAGELRTDLPTEIILYHCYARSCDPAVDYMLEYGNYSADAIVEHMLQITFGGIAPGKSDCPPSGSHTHQAHMRA